jgi:chitin synthase
MGEPSGYVKPKRHLYATQYQCLSLGKQMIMRTDEQANHFDGLESCTGLFPLPRDGRFFPGILNSLRTRPADNKVKMLIAVSMFNEKPAEVIHTLSGIIDNLKYFRLHGVRPRDICCVVICDGLEAFMQTVEETRRNKHFFSQFFNLEDVFEKFNVSSIAELGSLINAELKSAESPEPEFAHCFQLNVTKDDETAEGLQLIWAVKHYNKRKLNTHLWFFGGFCELLQPLYCQLVDVGTRPRPDAIWKLYERLELDDKIAGCCGEIVPMNARYWNLIEAAQVVEYKYAHLFDKALESIVGYITVLPGAFSAYRWKALQGAPLWKDYFKSICHPEIMDAFNSNIYLAEDRVLCLALVTKANESYLLTYVQSSVAETDIPDDMFRLLRQRRRWINGSWFALIDNLKRWKKIKKSSHTPCRQLLFSFLIFYYTLNVIFSWLMVGGFYLAIAIGFRRLTMEMGVEALGKFVTTTYTMLLAVSFFLALGVRPEKVEHAYKFLSYSFAVYIMIVILTLLYFVGVSAYSLEWAPFLMLVTIFVFTFTPLLYKEFGTVMSHIFQFVLITPTYVNIFLVYAICNTHDCTWGNRPDAMKHEERVREEDFKAFRTRWLALWAFCNAVYAFFFNTLDLKRGNSDKLFGLAVEFYIYGVAIYALFIIVVRFIGSMIFYYRYVRRPPRLPEAPVTELDPINRNRCVYIPDRPEDMTMEDENMQAPPVVVPETPVSHLAPYEKFSASFEIDSADDGAINSQSSGSLDDDFMELWPNS